MIVSAAIKINHLILSMPQPARHHDILRQISGLFDPRDRPSHSYESEVQGFLTDTGEFLNRRDAFKRANECGQSLLRRGGFAGDELFSEDLW